MDKDSQTILNTGRDFINFMKEDPDIPFDFSEKSIEHVQELIESLNDSEMTRNLKDSALIGATVYLGEMLIKNHPDLQFNVIIENNRLAEIQVSNKKGTLNLFSWVLKCLDDPKGDSIIFKYKRSNEILNS